MILFALPANAEEGNPASRAAYLKYCSACHGEDGRGDGIVATAMRPKPIDLTQLTPAGGPFPRARVMESIDGRRRIAAHGDSEMPVWGEIFLAETGPSLSEPAEVRGRVQLITEYVKAIQAH
ncbi:MAG: c-type cytochrome [Candidatus Binatia bacterium]